MNEIRTAVIASVISALILSGGLAAWQGLAGGHFVRWLGGATTIDLAAQRRELVEYVDTRQGLGTWEPRQIDTRYCPDRDGFVLVHTGGDGQRDFEIVVGTRATWFPRTRASGQWSGAAAPVPAGNDWMISINPGQSGDIDVWWLALGGDGQPTEDDCDD